MRDSGRCYSDIAATVNEQQTEGVHSIRQKNAERRHSEQAMSRRQLYNGQDTDSEELSPSLFKGRDFCIVFKYYVIASDSAVDAGEYNE
jgi:hypothetical protein